MKRFRLVVALGFLNALTPFSIDLYLPAFTQIARDLNTTVARVSLSVSTYFIGFALAQIIYGPLLDRYGRKRPIYAGLAIYVLASLGCMMATSVEMLLFFRMLSALGGAAASVGALAMVRDLFPPEDGAKIIANLMLVLSVSPLFAPFLGGVMVEFWGWRTLFLALTGLALVDFFLVTSVLPESFVPEASQRLHLGSVLRGFRDIFGNARFRVFTFAGSLSFAGLFIFVAGAPALLMGEFGLSPRAFSLTFALLAGGMIAGGQLNHLLVDRFGSQRVFEVTLMLEALTSWVFLALSWHGNLGVQGTVACLFLVLVAAGISYPNAAAMALQPFSRRAGSAAALLGFLQLGLGSAFSAIVGMLELGGTLPVAGTIAGSTLLAVGLVFCGRAAVLRAPLTD